MDMRERHIGPITTRVGDDASKMKVDAGALVRRLLLFEHCTLESDNLVGIPRLVAVFGFRGGPVLGPGQHRHGDFRGSQRE